MAGTIDIYAKLHDEVSAPAASIGKSIREGFGSIGANFANIHFAIRDVVAGFSNAATAVGNTFKTFIDAGSQAEVFQTRLVGLTGSIKGAKDMLAFYTEVAAKVPATLNEVVESGIALESFGAKSKETLVPLADLAAFMGVSMPEAAQAMGRAFAGGAGAADIFRERGVLTLIKTRTGIDDLTKLSLPQFRDAMMAAFTDPQGPIAGMADSLSKTWSGTISMLQDHWDKFKRQVADVILPGIKAAAEKVLETLDAWAKNGQLQTWAVQLGKTMAILWNGALSALPGVIMGLGSVAASFADLNAVVEVVGGAVAFALKQIVLPIGLVAKTITSGPIEAFKWFAEEGRAAATSFDASMRAAEQSAAKGETVKRQFDAMAMSLQDVAAKLQINVDSFDKVNTTAVTAAASIDKVGTASTATQKATSDLSNTQKKTADVSADTSKQVSDGFADSAKAATKLGDVLKGLSAEIGREKSYKLSVDTALTELKRLADEARITAAAVASAGAVPATSSDTGGEYYGPFPDAGPGGDTANSAPGPLGKGPASRKGSPTSINTTIRIAGDVVARTAARYADNTFSPGLAW